MAPSRQEKWKYAFLVTVATFWHTHKHTSHGIVLPAVATATRSAAPWQQAALTLISCTRVYDKIFSGSHDSPKDFFSQDATSQSEKKTPWPLASVLKPDHSCLVSAVNKQISLFTRTITISILHLYWIPVILIMLLSWLLAADLQGGLIFRHLNTLKTLIMYMWFTAALIIADIYWFTPCHHLHVLILPFFVSFFFSCHGSCTDPVQPVLALTCNSFHTLARRNRLNFAYIKRQDTTPCFSLRTALHNEP